jgi:hypothetical protein
MSDKKELRPIVEEIDYLLAERKQRAMECPRIVVVHGHHQPETDCLPGETVEQVSLVFASREFQLHLSPTGLLILDCLSRHRRTPLSAAHIERILSSDKFYLRHGANALNGNNAVVRPRRVTIKVYIQRIRVQFGKAIRKAGFSGTAEKLLVSEATDSNVVMYGLRVSVAFKHRCC